MDAVSVTMITTVDRTHFLRQNLNSIIRNSPRCGDKASGIYAYEKT